MGASKAGSLSFNDTCLVTTAIHQNVLELCWSRYLIVKIKMYICFATLYVHCVFYKSLCNPWVLFFCFNLIIKIWPPLPFHLNHSTSILSHYITYLLWTGQLESIHNHVFEVSVEDSSGSELPALLAFLNLLLRAINTSFEGGGGLSAIVGASNAGSLSFRDTCCVTMSTSSFLRRRILAIMTGM